jgi:hypothetical protein
VAERFRRQPAELLYEGSTPFPGSTGYSQWLNLSFVCSYLVHILDPVSIMYGRGSRRAPHRFTRQMRIRFESDVTKKEDNASHHKQSRKPKTLSYKRAKKASQSPTQTQQRIKHARLAPGNQLHRKRQSINRKQPKRHLMKQETSEPHSYRRKRPQKKNLPYE